MTLQRIEAALKGMTTTGLGDEWRDYRLVKLGLRLDEIDSAPARRLDWLVQIDNVVHRVETEAAQTKQ